MAGLVGWIDWKRDLRQHRPTVVKLAAALAHRGPDSEEHWIAEKVAFGHRGLKLGGRTESALAVLPVGGGHEIAVALVGFVADRALLPGGGGATGAEAIARAYASTGLGWVPGSRGAFTAAIWDGRTEELHLIRDHTGAEPLYWIELDHGVLFASERKALLTHPEVATVVRPEGLREAISQASAHGGVFDGVHRMPGATTLTISTGGIREDNFFAIRTAEHTDDYATTVRTVRELLEEGIRRQLPEHADDMVMMLSGGIDSSAVAALAAHQLRARGDVLRTLTIDADPEFRPDALRGSHDRPYAQLVADHLGADHQVVALGEVDILDTHVRTGMLEARDFPARQYDMDVAQFITVSRAAEQGARIALTGDASDKCFQSTQFIKFSYDTPDEETQFPWIAMAQKFGARHGFGTGLLDPDVLDRLDLTNWYHDKFADAVAGLEYLPGEDRQTRHIRRGVYVQFGHLTVDSSYPGAGMQPRVPMATPELLQYTFNIPHTMHAQDGVEKRVLRDAVADLLPAEVLSRPRSSSPATQSPDYVPRLQRHLHDVLTAGGPVLDLIDVPRATALADDARTLGRDRIARADVEMALQLDLWLRRYGIELVGF